MNIYQEVEIYPIGTDVVTEYIGRDSNGYGLFTKNKFINSSGEYCDVPDQPYAASDVFIPVDPSYRYKKSAYRIYNFTWYDEDFVKISQFNRNNLTEQELPDPPVNAKWFRFTTHLSKGNWFIRITRIQ